MASLWIVLIRHCSLKLLMPIPNCVCGLVDLGDHTLVQLLAQGDSISDNIVFAVESC